MIRRRSILGKNKGSGTTLLNDLYAAYALNEASGNIAYDFLGNNNATIYGSPGMNQPGKIDKSMFFSWAANDAYINTFIKNHFTVYSVAIWFYPTIDPTIPGAYSESRIIIGYEYNFNINWNHGGYSSRRAGEHRASNGYKQVQMSGYTINAWNHVVLTYDGTYLRIYTNGSLSDAEAHNTPYRQTSGTGIKIGAHYFADSYSGKRVFDGYLEQAAFWTRALTQTEIDLIYNSGNGLALENW
jgi:hypothetical protein